MATISAGERSRNACLPRGSSRDCFVSRAFRCLCARAHQRTSPAITPKTHPRPATSIPLAAAKTGAGPRWMERLWKSGGEPISPAWSHV